MWIILSASGFLVFGFSANICTGGCRANVEIFASEIWENFEDMSFNFTFWEVDILALEAAGHMTDLGELNEYEEKNKSSFNKSIL